MPLMSVRPINALAPSLALAYALLVAYACLHPLAGWRDSGLPGFDWLWAPWPKYFILEDFVFNILGYLPLGLLLAATLPAQWGFARKAALATVLAALFSLGLEALQNYLPSRVASNLDLGGNAAGALIGALIGARWGGGLLGAQGSVQRWRARYLIGGRSGEAGLVLLALWLLGQLGATDLVFASGDIRSLLGIPPPLPFRPERFIAFDTALTASALLAVGLLVRCMTRGASPLPVLAVLALGIGAKTLATWIFFEPGMPLAWVTPGASRGLLLGTALLLPALLLPRLAQHAIAGTSLLLATALVNLIPENPYLPFGRRLAGFSNVLNYHGLTQLVDSLWPYAALAYLSALGLWRGEHLAGGARQRQPHL